MWVREYEWIRDHLKTIFSYQSHCIVAIWKLGQEQKWRSSYFSPTHKSKWRGFLFCVYAWTSRTLRPIVISKPKDWQRTKGQIFSKKQNQPLLKYPNFVKFSPSKYLATYKRFESCRADSLMLTFSMGNENWSIDQYLVGQWTGRTSIIDFFQ